MKKIESFQKGARKLFARIHKNTDYFRGGPQNFSRASHAYFPNADLFDPSPWKNPLFAPGIKYLRKYSKNIIFEYDIQKLWYFIQDLLIWIESNQSSGNGKKIPALDRVDLKHFFNLQTRKIAI